MLLNILYKFIFPNVGTRPSYSHNHNLIICIKLLLSAVHLRPLFFYTSRIKDMKIVGHSLLALYSWEVWLDPLQQFGRKFVRMCTFDYNINTIYRFRSIHIRGEYRVRNINAGAFIVGLSENQYGQMFVGISVGRFCMLTIFIRGCCNAVAGSYYCCRWQPESIVKGDRYWSYRVTGLSHNCPRPLTAVNA